ncbi:hypothetical protein NYE76_14960 [Paenibacillus sp. FSL M7-0831]|nr:hypothetical protein PbDSM24746_34930 [Paenibacillus macerans]GBK69801.1 hypothetical protein PbJCM17693_35090 [Paenibacillus macerans]
MALISLKSGYFAQIQANNGAHNRYNLEKVFFRKIAAAATVRFPRSFYVKSLAKVNATLGADYNR